MKPPEKSACLWHPLEDIEAVLEAVAGTPDDVRSLGLEELTDLIHFHDRLFSVTNQLGAVIEKARNPYDERVLRSARPVMRVPGIIASLDHPVLVRLRAKYERFWNTAVEIRRAAIKRLQ